MDGAPHGSVIQAGLHQPFMFLMSDHGDMTDSVSPPIGRRVDPIIALTND